MDPLKYKKIKMVKRSFRCEECKKSFSKRRDLERHILTHTGEKPFQCKECGKHFSREDNLKAHNRSHTGIKPFKCDDCNKSFSQKCDLKVHMRTHTGVKPYMCEDCGKCFSRKHHCTRHVRTHTGEKPFVCKECGKRFSLKESLINHKKIHTGKKPYDKDLIDLCEQTAVARRKRGAPVKYANDQERKRERFIRPNENRYCIDIGLKNKEKWELMKQHANMTSNADFARKLLDLYERSLNMKLEDTHAENVSFLSGMLAIAASNSQKGTNDTADDEETMSRDYTEGLTKEENHRNYDHIHKTQAEQSVNDGHVSNAIKTEPVGQTRSLALKSVEEVTVKVETVISNDGEGNQAELRTNTGNEGYTCYICSRDFTQMGKLKKGLRTHIAEAPYWCNICGENVNDVSSMKAHMRVHALKIPYKCGVCESCFIDSTALTMHIRKHWIEKV